MSCVDDLNELNCELQRFHGYAARFWSYSVSNAELEIHLYRTGGDRAILLCAGTGKVRISSGAWRAALEIIAIGPDLPHRLVRDTEAMTTCRAKCTTEFDKTAPNQKRGVAHAADT